MQRDVRGFVAACAVCAQKKEPRTHPHGLLHSLPIPTRPWSYISLDFVTGLPKSQGNTVILVVVDRFSKACHLIPLPKIPTAGQTADLLMQHVFRIHGFPQDMVSDRGSQFTSRFWKSFGRLIEASISLSSGFHPNQMDRQRESTRRLKRLSDAWSLIIRLLGALSWFGLNLHRTLYTSDSQPVGRGPLVGLRAPSGGPRRQW